MQTSIAQIVALTTYGNSILQGAPDSCSFGLQSSNSTFKHCEWVQFSDIVAGSPARKESVYATDPHHWFEHLKEESVYALRMSYGPTEETKIADRILVGFAGGGGKWLIETRAPARSDYWKSRWLVGDRERADRKIWRVTYVRIASSKGRDPDDSENLEGLKDELKEGVQEIAEFSRSQNLDGFTKAFESALSRLESRAPLEGLYNKDMAPVDFLPLAAEQLLGSAEAAWVFGGMGSWNDQGFEGQTQERYEQVSEKLYKLLNRVIVEAANSGKRASPAASS